MLMIYKMRNSGNGLYVNDQQNYFFLKNSIIVKKNCTTNCFFLSQDWNIKQLTSDLAFPTVSHAFARPEMEERFK